MPTVQPGLPNVAAAFLELDVYTNDTKTSTVTTTNNVISVGRTMGLNAPYQYSVNLPLGDPLGAGLAKNLYCEVKVGWTSKTLWLSGYVDKVQKTDGGAGTYTVSLNSALAALADYNILGMAEYAYPGYQSIIDVLNGTNLDGHAAVAGQRGVLKPGWTAVWVGAGTPPGLGAIWTAEWESSLQALIRVAQHYRLYFREKLPTTGFAGCTRNSGIVEIGPLGDIAKDLVADPSGLTNLSLWGGDPLMTQLQALYPHMPNYPIAQFAQEQNIIQISTITSEENDSDIHNLIWSVGTGTKNHIISISPLFNGGKGPKNKDGTVDTANGVVVWPAVADPEYYAHQQPYYVFTNSKADWQGHTFELVAREQNNGQFAYGVVDRTSTALYGIRELPHDDPRQDDYNEILAACAGALETATKPLRSWTAEVIHPLNLAESTNQVPTPIAPGQRIASINYEGKVYHPQAWNATTGQWDTTATPYSIMKFPANNTDTGDATGATLALLQTVIEVSDTISDGQDFRQTITLGKSKPDSARAADDALMQEMEHHKRPGRTAHRHFKRKNFDHIPVWMSQGSGSPWGDVYEDRVGDQLVMRPNGYAITLPPKKSFLSDHKHFSCAVQLSDTYEAVDIIACKPGDNKLLTSDSVDGPFLIVRLAEASSGKASGLYIHHPGDTPGSETAIGTIDHDARVNLLDGGLHVPNGTYLVSIHQTGGRYDVTLSTADVNPGDLDYVWVDYTFSRWDDRGAGATLPLLDPTGSIGWRVWAAVGAANSVFVSDVHATAQPKRKVTRSQQHHRTVGHAHWHGVNFAVFAWDGTNATVRARLTQATGKYSDNSGNPVRTDDGTLMQWSASTSPFNSKSIYDLTSLHVNDYIVYNGSIFDVPDRRGGVIRPDNFGVMSAVASKHTHDSVDIIGHLSSGVDYKTKKPWIVGWGHGHLQAAGHHIGDGAVALNHHHPTAPHHKRRKLSSAQFAAWQAKLAKIGP